MAEDFKKEHRNSFHSSGELYGKWHDIYSGSDYLSKWARHRLDTALGLLSAYGLGKKGNALDIGIGSGVLMREVGRMGARTYGADISLDLAARLRNSGCRRLMVADVESLPLSSKAFDLVTCLGVLEYVPDDRKALGELYRIISPGGHLVLAVASYHRYNALLNMAARKLLKGLLGKKKKSGSNTANDGVRMVKPSSLKKLAIESGFRVREFRCFGGRLFGRYVRPGFRIPGVIYLGDHCLLVLQRPEKP